MHSGGNTAGKGWSWPKFCANLASSSGAPYSQAQPAFCQESVTFDLSHHGMPRAALYRAALRLIADDIKVKLHRVGPESGPTSGL